MFDIGFIISAFVFIALGVVVHIDNLRALRNLLLSLYSQPETARRYVGPAPHAQAQASPHVGTILSDSEIKNVINRNYLVRAAAIGEEAAAAEAAEVARNPGGLYFPRML